MSYPPRDYPTPPPGWYGQGGQPQFGAPPPRGNRRWVWILLASAAVLTVVGVVIAAVVGQNADSGSTTATTGAAGPGYQEPTATTPSPTPYFPTTTAAPTPTPTTTGPAIGGAFCGEFSTGPGPTTPAGWHTVVGPRGLAYDVPPDWTVADCGTLIGWEKPCADGPFGFCPIRTMSGSASLETPQCLKDSVAVSGLPGAKNARDINEAVRLESDLVKDIYTSKGGHVPAVALSAPRNLTVGDAPAVQIVATVTDIETSTCVGPTALHSMVATTVPGQEGAVLFVISLTQGIPGVPDPSVIDQMVSTLRRAGS